MFNLTRSNPFDDIFNFQREMDRVFNQFWSDLPTRTASAAGSFQVDANDDGWRVNVPLPGIDPQHVNLEAAGNTLSIRAEVPQGEGRGRQVRYQQTLTVPQFLDVERLSARHEHGMLQLTLPLKDSVKPRRIQIESRSGTESRSGSEQPQLTGAAAGR
jgi:HSP20 family protein